MSSIRIDIESVAKLQILITERSILETEVEAMKVENSDQGENANQYGEDAFFGVAEKLEAVKDKMQLLLTDEQIIKRGKK